MIATFADAQKIIGANYRGLGLRLVGEPTADASALPLLSIGITTGPQRTRKQIDAGVENLVWRRAAASPSTSVEIGRIMADTTVDWAWDLTTPMENGARAAKVMRAHRRELTGN